VFVGISDLDLGGSPVRTVHSRRPEAVQRRCRAPRRHRAGGSTQPLLGPIAAALALAAVLAACRQRTPEARAEPRRYSVRAEILRLPDARRFSEMVVRHEAIDDFVDETGQVVGMDAMEMSFPVTAPLSARGLAVGDKVALRFTVDFQKASLAIEQIEKLPANTALRWAPAASSRGTAPGRP